MRTRAGPKRGGPALAEFHMGPNRSLFSGPVRYTTSEMDGICHGRMSPVACLQRTKGMEEDSHFVRLSSPDVHI